jgi:hypothetical protein
MEKKMSIVEQTLQQTKARIELNVGGKIQHTTMATLQKKPSKLSRLLEKDPFATKLFIDRDLKEFKYVLDFLRYGELLVDPALDEVSLKKLEQEFTYWELHQEASAIKDLRMGKVIMFFWFTLT